MNISTIYDRNGTQFNCFQFNYGTNKTGLVKAKVEGWKYGYEIVLYTPPYDTDISFDVTDNSARIVEDEVRERVSLDRLLI